MLLVKRKSEFFPMIMISNHGVKNDQKFAHTSRQNHFGCFSFFSQSFRKFSNRRIKSRSRQHGHIQSRSHLAPSPFNITLPFPFSTFMVIRSDTNQSGDLLSSQLSQFGQIRQQRVCGDRTDPGNTCELLELILPNRLLWISFFND